MPANLLLRFSLALGLSTGVAQAQHLLAPGVVLVPGTYEPGRQPDGNSLLLAGNDGWLLIDSGRHRAHAEQVLASAGRSIRAVLNTHWHLDHLGGNAWLRAQQPGLQVWAAPAVAQGLAPEGWLGRYGRQLAAALPTAGVASAEPMRVDLDLLAQAQALQPDHVIAAAGPQRLAGRDLIVGMETAVSGGDLWVLDSATGTLAAGDLVTLPVPFFDTACPEAWREALGRLAAQPFTRLVPGHGPVMTRADFDRWRGGFEALLACSAEGLHPAACAAVWRSRVAPGLVPVDDARITPMLGYYAKTLLQAPPETRDRFCRRP